MYFAVLLLDGTIVESKFAQRLKLFLFKFDIGPTMKRTTEQVSLYGPVHEELGAQ